MNEAKARLIGLRDEQLPAMPAMLGPEAVDLLAAAVAGAGGQALSARPLQITWRPGRSLLVTYEVQVAWNKNLRTSELYVAATGTSVSKNAVVVARDDQQVAVWQMSRDPVLPGLGVVTDPDLARKILEQLGTPDEPFTTRIRAYRPSCRAVVELSGTGFRLFVKVVPPAEVPALQERHRVLSTQLPVPLSHGWSGEYGLVVLEALTGPTLRDCLLDKKQRLPSAQAFADLLDRIPEVPDGRTAPSPVRAASEHACLVRSLLPELGDRITALLDGLSVCRESFPLVPVHGDLHEAQVLVRGGEVVGLLDIDTAGAGYRIDDWANFVGHLAAWQTSVPAAGRKRIEGLTLAVLAAADAETGDPAELRRRVAAVIMGLATGPFRAQTPTWPADTRARIALAERWMERANERTSSDKDALTGASQSSHVRTRE